MNKILLTHLIIFLFLVTSPVSAYIDPATGSMLFSALIGILASSYFLLKQIFMKLKFVSRKEKSDGKDSHSIILYSEGAQYWNVFKPLLEGLVEAGEPSAYYTADKNDPGLQYESPLVETRFIGEGNRAYMRLNMLEADICVTTTPGLDVLQFKRSKRVKHYAHILHHLNTTATYRLFGLDYYDSVLLNGPHQAGVIRELERKRNTRIKDLLIVGSTYLDVLSEKKAALPPREDNEFTILVSPSWGPNGLLSRYGMDLLKPLALSGMKLILRPHPQSSISEKALLENLKNVLKNYENIRWDFEKDGLHAMSCSDVMISDFSSIMFDYIFLFSKPVAVFNFSLDPRGFDLSDINEENPHYMVKDSGAILHFDTETFDDIPNQIRSLTVQPELQRKIQDLRELAWKHQGEAGKQSAQAVLKLRESVLSGLKTG